MRNVFKLNEAPAGMSSDFWDVVFDGCLTKETGNLFPAMGLTRSVLCPACPPFGAARAAGAQQARFAKLHLSPGWPQPRSSRRAAACAAGPLSARRSRFSTRLNSSRAILSPRPRCPPPPPSAHPASVVSLDQTRAHLPWGVPVAGSDGALPGLTITAADAHPLRRQDASRFTSSFKAQITNGVGSLPPPPAHLQAAHGAAVPGSRASVRRSSQWTI